jgi:hypothetical protein
MFPEKSWSEEDIKTRLAHMCFICKMLALYILCSNKTRSRWFLFQSQNALFVKIKIS